MLTLRPLADGANGASPLAPDEKLEHSWVEGYAAVGERQPLNGSPELL